MLKAIAHHLPTGAQPVPQHDATWYRTSLGSPGVNCPSCVTSQLLVPLQSSHWQGMRREVLDLYKQHSATTELSVCYQY